MDKSRIAEVFFNDIKPKHLKEFEEITPQGNIIKGFISKKPNRYLGSMVITEVTLKEKGVTYNPQQFIQAMPKIHYFDRHHEMFEDDYTLYYVYEKLDGSCLILYALYYDDEVVEVIPRTRGLPVADKHIIEMYNEIDHCNIMEFFKQNKMDNPTLMFELYGALNQHSIFYPTVRINIALLGGTFNSDFLTTGELNYLRKQYDFLSPTKIFKIIFNGKTWRINMVPGLFMYYLIEKMTKEEEEDLFRREYPTQLDVFQSLKSMITLINDNFLKHHNRLLFEGVVVNTFLKNSESFSYIKVKSADIEEKCRTENGVPRRFILKEVHKYFDEYGSQAKDIYSKDRNHYKEYVNRNLLEEFDSSAVKMKRTQKRIENVFLDTLEAKEPPIRLQEACHNIIEQYPSEDIANLMRIFAQEYPEKKRQARLAYTIFERLV